MQLKPGVSGLSRDRRKVYSSFNDHINLVNIPSVPAKAPSIIGVDYGRRWELENKFYGQLILENYPDQGSLSGCVFKVTATANGNDEWHYDCAVFALYDNSHRIEWQFHRGYLNSRDSKEVSQEFRFPPCNSTCSD